MNARDYLNEARATIQDRGAEYGHPSDNMARTAALWSSYLEMPVTDYQVAMCMALVKIARSMETAKTDTYIDLVAYASIAAQLHTEENELYVWYIWNGFGYFLNNCIFIRVNANSVAVVTIIGGIKCLI